MFSYAVIFFGVYSVILICPSDAFLKWFFDGKAADTEEIIGDNDRRVPTMKNDVPFEMAVSDEKFLVEQHLTKDLSPLDTCHHLVISEIKSTCTSLTEEELGKLAVRLLNCQSEAEGRTTYDCDRDMSLGECTREMDATTWNAYQITSNRARAICYSTRQQQFRKKTEYTVNRLIQSTEGQVHAMNHIKEGQERIKQATVATLEKMELGQSELLSRQEKLKSEQMNIQTYIASNLRELTREKALIASGNKELVDMTDLIQKKLDNATKKLEKHEKNQKANHEEVLRDLAAIQHKARGVWQKLDRSSQHVLQYHNDTTRHYMQTLYNLRRVNQTITYVLNTIATLEASLDEKLGWISTHLGGTGDRLQLLSTVVLHAMYFLIAAVSVSFLQTPLFSRVTLLLLVPLNAWSEVKHGQSLGFTAMTLFILVIVIVNWLVEWAIHCHQARKAGVHVERFSCASSGSMSSTNSPVCKMLAPTSSPEVPVFDDVAKNGLSTPDLRKLVHVIETLCKQGVLSPVSNPSTSEAVAGNFTDVLDISTHTELPEQDCVSLMSEAGDGAETPQDSSVPPCHIGLLDISAGRVITDSAKARVELVRRRLLSSPSGDSPLSRHRDRAATPLRSHLARPSPTRSTPGRSSSRSSRSSTPRPSCLALTKMGLPCRNACSEMSSYCFRHNPDAEEDSE